MSGGEGEMNKRRKLLKQSTKENQLFIHFDDTADKTKAAAVAATSITKKAEAANNECAAAAGSANSATAVRNLTVDEKKYLFAARNGDIATVKRMICEAYESTTAATGARKIDVNCVDALGRGALNNAIESENLEMVELLIVMGVKPRDALLHAINAEFVEAVEMLLEYEEIIYVEGEKYSWETVDWNTAVFTSDITPLILAAHKNNFEILKILLDRGAALPIPHPVGCGCSNCAYERRSDSLRYSMSRVNEYRALASSSLIALTSADPIRTAFKLSWELRNLSKEEKECQQEYTELQRNCQQFALDLLDEIRSSAELDTILNHRSTPNDGAGEHSGSFIKSPLLHLAIRYRQKTPRRQFIAHPHIQQLLTKIWYDGLPGYRSKSILGKLYDVALIAALFPVYCLSYILFPDSELAHTLQNPATKFLVHVTSYLSFLGILILVSQRAEIQVIEIFGTDRMKENLKKFTQRQRGNGPSFLEWIVLLFVLGYIKEEYLEIKRGIGGIQSYFRNTLWNVVEFFRNSIYICVIVLRIYAYISEQFEIQNNPENALKPREKWSTFDPQLIAEGFFAMANILSALKLVHMFSINSHLGPLQISLGRMFIDIMKFFTIYALVLFSFACGLNQLLWYYAALERKKCFTLPDQDTPDWNNAADSCYKWRSFGNLFESIQTLFWTGFGEVGLSSFDLAGINSYTRFWALLMFAAYSVLNVTILLNLLIAMMSNSYSRIAEQADIEWKFARTKLWLNYFQNKSTLPAPYNILPTKKTILELMAEAEAATTTTINTTIEECQKTQFTTIMEALVRRYVSRKHNRWQIGGGAAAAASPSTIVEDHVHDLKSEMSSLKYQIIEIFKENGFQVQTTETNEEKDQVLNRKLKIWKRQLMEDFHIGLLANTVATATSTTSTTGRNADHISNRSYSSVYGGGSDVSHRRWKYSRHSSKSSNNSQIGKCRMKKSLKNKQSTLQKTVQDCKAALFLLNNNNNNNNNNKPSSSSVVTGNDEVMK